MNIWEEFKKPISVLAPMEGVTDLAFRRVIAHAGRPDLFYTEFTNVSSFASEKGRENALERLKTLPSETPIIAQIWGKNPDHFSELASALKSLGFSGIDLNFGCPDRHVNRAGDASRQKICQEQGNAQNDHQAGQLAGPGQGNHKQRLVRAHS